MKCKTDNSLNTFCVLFGKVRVRYLASGCQVEEKREELSKTEKSRALPEKTLGILVRKLFTVRMGMPFFSSCMRAITSSIWETQVQWEGRGGAERKDKRKSKHFLPL